MFIVHDVGERIDLIQAELVSMYLRDSLGLHPVYKNKGHQYYQQITLPSYDYQ
jgi:hypothetical protein